jgi:hypothetical protein
MAQIMKVALDVSEPSTGLMLLPTLLTDIVAINAKFHTNTKYTSRFGTAFWYVSPKTLTRLYLGPRVSVALESPMPLSFMLFTGKHKTD